jgi:hypothetical protein
MTTIKGSAAFRVFSYGAFILFAAHVAIQWLMNKIIGPFGKKSSAESAESDRKSTEALEVNKIEGGQEKLDDGFKEIDLTR